MTAASMTLLAFSSFVALAASPPPTRAGVDPRVGIWAYPTGSVPSCAET